jgi:hypothetical protein
VDSVLDATGCRFPESRFFVQVDRIFKTLAGRVLMEKLYQEPQYLHSGARRCYFIAIPWGRAGPVLKAVLKSSLNRLSSVRVSCVTLRTWTLWSPSK